MGTIKINPKFIKDGLVTFDHMPLFVESKEEQDYLSSQDDIYLDTINLLRDSEYQSNVDLEILAGAKSTSKNKENRRSKTALDIHKIGTDILQELLGDRINIAFNSADDTRLMKFIMSFLNKHSYNLNNAEFEYLVRFLRDNIYKVVKERIMSKHSLAAISEYRLTPDSIINSVYGPMNCGTVMFNQKVAITREVSNKWNGLSTLADLMGKTKMEKDVIDPLFFILFGNKLPGIEDLIIRSDYQSLVNQIRNKEIHRDSMFLFLLRMIDPEFVPSTNKEHQTPLGNETLRISISMLLREIAYNLRRGIFEDKASCFLVKLLEDIRMPTAKFREENMLQAILAVFSFKPTLITKGLITAPKFNIFNPTSSTIIYETPKSVYTIEYPISDMYCFSDNNIPRLTQTNFELLGFDGINKKVVFTYSDNKNLVQEEQSNLIQNLYNILSTNRIEADVNNVIPTIVARQPSLEHLYKNMTPIQILLTNGFYIAVPREQSTFNTCPSTNIFYRPTFKPSINLSRVLVEPIITVNKISYELVGALCYDIIDDEVSVFGAPIIGNSLYTVDISMKLGTFALVKSNNIWYEYNPQDTITLDRKKNKIERILLNKYKKLLAAHNAEFDAVLYESWKAEEGQEEKVRQDVNDNKVTISDMEIDESEAMEKISTRCCLLFYAENYDMYQSRIFEKCY